MENYTQKEITAMKRALDIMGLDGKSGDYIGEEVDISTGRNGRKYAWLRWDEQNILVDVETGETMEATDGDGSEAEQFILDQFC